MERRERCACEELSTGILSWDAKTQRKRESAPTFSATQSLEM